MIEIRWRWRRLRARAGHTEGFEGRRSPGRSAVLWQIEIENQFVDIGVCDIEIVES